MFINEVKTLADFAVEFSVLNKLLSDPKNLKTMVEELKGAEAVIAKRNEVLAMAVENKKLSDSIAQKDSVATKALESAQLALAEAEKAKAEALNIRKSAEITEMAAKNKLDSATKLEARNNILVKKSEEKATSLGGKMAEVEAKSVLLDESISRYNDAIAKLSQVKVA